MLIHDLLHAHSIGYSGPQFAYFVNNLTSALQKPNEIDDSFCRECEVAEFSGYLLHFPYVIDHMRGLKRERIIFQKI